MVEVCNGQSSSSWLHPLWFSIQYHHQPDRLGVWHAERSISKSKAQKMKNNEGRLGQKRYTYVQWDLMCTRKDEKAGWPSPLPNNMRHKHWRKLSLSKIWQPAVNSISPAAIALCFKRNHAVHPNKPILNLSKQASSQFMPNIISLLELVWVRCPNLIEPKMSFNYINNSDNSPELFYLPTQEAIDCHDINEIGFDTNHGYVHNLSWIWPLHF